MLLTSVGPPLIFVYLVCFFPPVMADVAVIVKDFIFAVEVAVGRLAANRALRLIFEHVR